MSVKRSFSEVSTSSSENEMTAKTIYSIEEIPDDMLLKSETLSEEEKIKVALEFDQIYSEFFIRFKKEKDDEVKTIVLSVECLKEIIRQIPIVQTIINRYKGSGKNAAFRFPVGKDVVLKVEESFGAMWIDIRRYFYLNHQEKPTKTGVKMSADNITKLQSILTFFMERVENCISISPDIMLHSYMALILKDVEASYDLKSPFCDGCKINSPSQKDHTQEGGCMFEQVDIAVKIEAHIKEAFETVKLDDVKKLAHKVSKLMNIPLICPTLDDFTIGQIKKMIMDPQLDTQETFIVARSQC